MPDDHACIPEADRKPADERKDYFKVQVRREYLENFKLKKLDTYYIVAANDVGQAKERLRAEAIKRKLQARQFK